MELEALAGLGGIPIIQALTAWIKTQFPQIPDQYGITIALTWGIILNVTLTLATHVPYWQAIVVGVIAGLAASGLYTASKRASRD